MNEATLHYVQQHAGDDVRQLALRGCKDAAVDLPMALQQIQGRQTARRKLPTWAACDALVYPPHLNMEQCSSELTARYKARLCQRLLSEAAPDRPATLVDLTGGLGVDFHFMSAVFDRATYVERDGQLFPVSSENLRLLSRQAAASGAPVPELTFENADGMDFFRTLRHPVTLFFLDPARRDTHGARTYGIGDCTPNVLDAKDELLRRARYVLLKLSPMLDWRKAMADLGQEFVREVHIVATGGECKELLLLLSATRQGGGAVPLCCVNDDELFVADAGSRTVAAAGQELLCPAPGQYLYEPNAAIMKAGCFGEVARAFGVSQIAVSSHLFVGSSAQAGFPGRRFVVENVCTMNKRELKSALGPLRQANISVRNFPLPVAELRRRLKLSEGGSTFIFATTLANGNHVLLFCQRL